MLIDPQTEAIQRGLRPCRLRFFTKPIEDRTKTLELGYPVSKGDEIWVEVKAPGQSGNTTSVEKLADTWISEKRAQRDPFYAAYADAFEIWKKDETQPVIGTKLDYWPPIRPHELDSCKKANIKTVEELSTADEGTLNKIGLGARQLKEKAVEWMRVAKDVGSAASRIAALEKRIRELEAENADLRTKRKPGRPAKEEPVVKERAAPVAVGPGFNAEID